LLICVNLKEKFSIGKRCQDFFHFFIISLKREKSQDFFIEGFVYGIILLERWEKSFARGKDFFHKESMTSFVPDEQPVRV